MSFECCKNGCQAYIVEPKGELTGPNTWFAWNPDQRSENLSSFAGMEAMC